MRIQEQLSPLRDDLAHQLTVSTKLSEFGYELSSAVNVQANRKDLIFLALADKCLMTAGAIQLLCEKGFVDDGLALVRVLIEATVNAGYILESSDSVADDYGDYPQFLAWEIFVGMRAVDPMLTEGTADTEIEELINPSRVSST
jgi:hypothetical protein